MADITGIVLAAGAGTRAGGPKALLRMPDGTPWLELAATALLDGGCSRVIVVLGAQARIARPLVPIDDRVTTVVAMEWEQGMSESLRIGLAAADGDAALITLVDLPELPAAVVRRVLDAPGALRQATYGGRPGHPVYIAAEHWVPVAATLTGDHGARAYLVQHGVDEVDCADLWDGADRDAG
ncbi:MAG: nucleotidyltransferase family protein [Rhodoglobus sp.]|jgi:CTP:molybdopterin cytidylyltransferase MocA|nr:nucleotidyltransferase family protein [Rhodoglobus sp.]